METLINILIGILIAILATIGLFVVFRIITYAIAKSWYQVFHQNNNHNNKEDQNG